MAAVRYSDMCQAEKILSQPLLSYVAGGKAAKAVKATLAVAFCLSAFASAQASPSAQSPSKVVRPAQSYAEIALRTVAPPNVQVDRDMLLASVVGAESDRAVIALTGECRQVGKRMIC